jgi:hypothetical protein
MPIADQDPRTAPEELADESRGLPVFGAERFVADRATRRLDDINLSKS